MHARAMIRQAARGLIGTLVLAAAALGAERAFRPPAVPLVACDPYFSIWSPADRLTDQDTVHWTGKPQRLTAMVRIDGQTYRVMGKEPDRLPALGQASLSVLPTRTVYRYSGAGVALSLSFCTAALPEDIDLLARPVTYLTFEVRATDAAAHDVAVYFDASAELAVNTPDQEVVWSRETVGDMAVLKVGSKDQPVLAKRGDDIRIDWGYLYVAAPPAGKPASAIALPATTREEFASAGRWKAESGALPGAVAAASAPVGALAFDLGKVSAAPSARWLMLAYDDLYSIQYMHKNLRPYWRRNGWEAADLLQAAARDYEPLQRRCAAFDEELMSDLIRAGGEEYARLCALAYRQCFAAGKFVADRNGQPLQFCKENHSNGCISTSDVFYPMSPQFLLFGPSLAKSFLVPFMNYAASDRWKFPFAPHDLGQYPHANGQRYGGGERSDVNQMPVEESGNLLLLMAAVAQMEGTADFAGRYWRQLEGWAEYLRAKGFDPENQLCTDDFAGHLAHNVNLSAKAICGLGAFARLCSMRGEEAKARAYQELAKGFAARWVQEADDGDHFRLAFDRPGTWSQKYNLVWDRILGLDLFPAEVLRKEMDYYRRVQNQYGLPLDNRQTYTKLDWILWTATLTQDRDDFLALVHPVVRFLNETPDRVPMTDWYWTLDAKRRGFTARPVVGGVFLQMLYDRAVWAKYAGRDKTRAGNWAPMPSPPQEPGPIPAGKRAATAKAIDLVLVAGQSNAVGFDATPAELPHDPADRQILFWWRCGDPPPDEHDSTSGGRWTHLQVQPRGNPLAAKQSRQYGNFRSPAGGFGPEIGLARALRAKEGKPLAIVKVAFSGTGIRTDWDPAAAGEAGACYRALLAETKAALAAAKAEQIALRPRALAWIQGESDADPEDAPHYEKALAAMLASLRRDLGAPELIALLAVNAQYGGARGAFIPRIIEAQKSLAAKDPRCAYVDTSTAEVANSVHFSGAGTLDVGRRLAEALLAVESQAARRAGRR